MESMTTVQRKARRLCVEEIQHRLSIADLRDLLRAAPGASARVAWPDGGEVQATVVELAAGELAVRLRYSVKVINDSEDYDYVVPVGHITLTFGNRPCWRCPACARRALSLFRPRGEDCFSCSRCAAGGLTFKVQRLKSRAFRIRRAAARAARAERELSRLRLRHATRTRLARRRIEALAEVARLQREILAQVR